MDISKRLLRRPIATASWLALLLLAALLVQLGFGLIYAAQRPTHFPDATLSPSMIH